jgi:integrase
MGKLNPKGLKALLTKSPGRHADGDGLYFKTLGLGRAYWTFRYTVDGRGRETSLGPFPEVKLEEARIKHAELRAAVLKKIDPRAKASSAAKAGAPTFGQMADQYIAAHEGSWRNRKHRQQWSQTLTTHAASIRNMPVGQVDANAVRRVLEPIWNTTPETASRLRARIEAVLAAAQVAGHIDHDRPNPARWKGWLDHMLPNPRRLGERGHHPALRYADVPAFMARLRDTAGTASRALQFTILTAARSGETLGMTWDEVDFDTATWVVPASRMKMRKEHAVPLSEQAVAILRAQEAQRGNPHIFAGRPQRPLSGMAMSVLLRRMKVNATVHGMRSSARSWMADNGVEFELAEACLAHAVGNAVVQAYQRSQMLGRRRPIMQSWAKFLTGEADDKVVPLKRAGA